MKVIVAFIQPFMAQRVVDALHRVDRLSGATFTRVRGFGRERAAGATEEELTGTTARVRVEAIVPDDLEADVVTTIRDAARTGRKGDGKIYVSPVMRVVRIRTGEQDIAAV